MYTINYTKKFYTGILKGLIVPCKVHLVDEKAFTDFIDWLNAHVKHSDIITNDEWYASDISFVRA